MFAKHSLVSFTQLILVQTVFSECWRGREFAGNVRKGAVCDGPIRYDSIADWVVSGIYPEKLTTVKFGPTFGGVLAVKSRSTLQPTGISVESNNFFEGLVEVAGELPFVGTSTVKGLMPSIGNGAINHSCGNGFNALTSVTLVSSPGPHTPPEYGNPSTTPAFDTVLMGPDTSFAASVSPTPGISIGTDMGVPYTIAASSEPDMPLSSCDILLDSAISGGAFDYIVPYKMPHLESVLSQPVLPSSSCVSSQSFVGSPYISYCEEGLTNVPYDTELTVADRENLSVNSVFEFLPRGISLASSKDYEGSLQLPGEIPFLNNVGVDVMLPTTGFGDTNQMCGNDINIIVSDKTNLAPDYGDISYIHRNVVRPEADNLPEYGYYCNSVVTDYGCGL